MRNQEEVTKQGIRVTRYQIKISNINFIPNVVHFFRVYSTHRLILRNMIVRLCDKFR